MKKPLLFFILALIVFCSCNSKVVENKLPLQLNKNYPRWLKSGKYFPQQTSGISFIGVDDDSSKIFLLADDIGKIHHLKIKNDTSFSFSPVNFSNNVASFLDTFPKIDFEDLSLDKYTGKVYVSIEGNNPYPERYVGIYELIFDDNNIFSDTITDIKKMDIKPEDLFLKNISNNIGYEGITVDKNYFYFALEGFAEKGIFADSTIILIVDKNDLKIVKEINTKPLGIHTICGLYSDKDFSVYGVDRNNKKIFHLNFDSSLDVKNLGITAVQTNIPNYPTYDYVASLECITMDNENNLYLNDDPWKKFFIPSEEILDKLDTVSVNNFKNFVPIIYKFKIKK